MNTKFKRNTSKTFFGEQLAKTITHNASLCGKRKEKIKEVTPEKDILENGKSDIITESTKILKF